MHSTKKCLICTLSFAVQETNLEENPLSRLLCGYQIYFYTTNKKIVQWRTIIEVKADDNKEVQEREVTVKIF